MTRTSKATDINMVVRLLSHPRKRRLQSALMHPAATKHQSQHHGGQRKTMPELDQLSEIIADAVRGHVQSCFDNEKAHSDALNALTTAAEVAAYDFTTGW